MTSWFTRSLLTLTGAALALMPMAGIAAADDCVALGGTLGAGECSIAVVTAAKTGTFNLDENLHIKNGGILKVAPAGITIKITGDLIMDAGSQIDGDVFTAVPGAPITINATNDIDLLSAAPAGTPAGANIHSNAVFTSCAGTNRGGRIELNADSDHDITGNFTMQQGTTDTNGAKISSIASCGMGEIIITGVAIDIDGDVLSQGVPTKGRGGPITLNAPCTLSITDFGSVISLGQDPGADRVHLQGGCDVKIFGKVFSAGQGHVGGSDKCQPPERPGHPANSQACVEIWAGDSLTIDSKAPHNGEVSADTGFSGGIQGTGWVDLFSRGPIIINGDSVAPWAVHANQGLNNGHGGPITVKSLTDSITISGLGLQSSDLASGGQGGTIIVEAKLDVDLSGGRIQADGSTAGGGFQHGGHIFVTSFGTGAGNGSIIATASSLLDVLGRIPPDGTVALQACVGFGFPPGVIAPANLPAGNITKTVNCSGGTPVIPAYVVLPPCQCGGCPCVNSFRFVQGAPPKVTLSGTVLKAVTEVRLSTLDCNPTSGTAVPFIPPKTDTTLNVEVTGQHGTFHIITITPQGSCCSANTVTIP